MPNDTSGFTGNEIVARVQNFVGNTSSAFRTYVEQMLPLAEFRFCKMHDWTFLRKTNLSLAVTQGQAEYELSVANIGYYMAANDVESIFSEEANVFLKKTDLSKLRRLDSDSNDGNATDYPAMWAVAGDNKIHFWPPIFKTGTVKIDGKVTPSALTNLANFPTIPFRYQESFIEYCIAFALSREDDDRADSMKAQAMLLIKEDIKDNLSNLSETDESRIHGPHEKERDGSSGNVSSYPFWNWDMWE